MLLVLGRPTYTPVTPTPRALERDSILVLGTAEPEHDYLTLNGERIIVNGEPIWVS
jgi:hypothetical protein